MTSTRRLPPVEVLEDLDASTTDQPDLDVEAALLNALRPLGDASTKHNVQLNPTTDSASGASPTKTDSSPPRPITSHGLRHVKIHPPSQPTFNTDSPSKNDGVYGAPRMPQSHPDTALFAQSPTYERAGFYDGSFGGLPSLQQYGEADYGYKAPMKRTHVEPTPPKDRSAKKIKSDKDEPFELPDPKDMPPVHDDGTKPQQSYAEMIGMAILRAPHRRLTLAQIYKWISDNFAFYKSTESGWQNSIRHNLSLNKNFVKQERPKNDPGKGNYWAIKPGEERPYLLGKKNPPRRITNPDGSQYINGLPSEAGARPSSAPAIGNFTLAPNPNKKVETKTIDSAKFPDETDFPSDSTIPASDPALQEDEKEEDPPAMMPPPAHMRSSPPPADIGSSPPPMASQQRKDTPPPVPRFPSTSRSGNRRQKFAGLNDSGYWSSIESSAARGAARQLTSEADVSRPRIKKGRAEEEIVRIRSSSITADSPSKERLKFKAPASHFQSSSPARDDPLTPAVVFKKPQKPPPSISPNTNLRNHRDHMRALLGTPAKMFSPGPEATAWSPAFHLVEEGGASFTPNMSPYKSSKSPWKPLADHNDADHQSFLTSNAFDIFIDAPEEDVAARGSPEKRSARRPSLARAATSSGILADITGSAKRNNITLAPPNDSPFSLSPFFARPSPARSPAKTRSGLGSPLKQSHNPPSPKPTSTLNWNPELGGGAENIRPSADAAATTSYNLSHQDDPADLFGVHLPSDGSEEAIDLFQDFGKIGQAAPAGPPLFNPAANRANGSPVRRSNMGPPPARPVRPGMSRSSTSRF